MARLSKTHSFTIFEDGAVPTPDSEHAPPTDTPSRDRGAWCDLHKDKGDVRQAEAEAKADEVTELSDGQDVDADDERRQSSLTSSSSVSSVPDLQWRESIEHVQPTHQPYTPPIIRPSFRRPQSVQRMQMTSPRTSSARQSVIIKQYSRSGTPKLTRVVTATGSPKSRKWASTPSSDEEPLDEKQYPLILLQVTLLPMDPPWSAESMQELLPSQTIKQLQLLRSKLSETISQRGVLIPHPREEYELLQERLLEALELEQEGMRVCGYSSRRPSTEFSAGDSERDADSGMGESVDSSDGELCETCQHSIRTCNSAGGARNTGGPKWVVKVFAANGLMGPSAWTAAWSEMERVDVEISPWISDEMQRRLDEWDEREKFPRPNGRTREDASLQRMGDEKTTAKADGNISLRPVDGGRSRPQIYTTPHDEPELEQRPIVQIPSKQELGRLDEESLPMIYRPSQIPISVLLKNYIYLLTRDRRNVAMFLLGSVLVLLIATRSSPHPRPVLLSELDVPRTDCLAASSADVLLGGASFQAESQDAADSFELGEGAAGTVLEMIGASDKGHFEDA